MRLQSGMNLLFGPIIDRAIMVADQRKASDGERSKDARYEAIRRLAVREHRDDGDVLARDVDLLGACIHFRDLPPEGGRRDRASATGVSSLPR